MKKILSTLLLCLLFVNSLIAQNTYKRGNIIASNIGWGDTTTLTFKYVADFSMVAMGSDTPYVFIAYPGGNSTMNTCNFDSIVYAGGRTPATVGNFASYCTIKVNGVTIPVNNTNFTEACSGCWILPTGCGNGTSYERIVTLRMKPGGFYVIQGDTVQVTIKNLYKNPGAFWLSSLPDRYEKIYGSKRYNIYSNLTTQSNYDSLDVIDPCTITSVSRATITKSTNARVCDSILLSGPSKVRSVYSWYHNGNLLNTTTANSIYVKNSGAYSLRINTNDKFSCLTDTSNTITVVRFDDEKRPQICAVSVDSTTGKNEVIWEKIGITRATQYNVYKESTSSQFVLIGTVAPNLFSTFIDTGSYPLKQAYRYKLTLTDSCGYETPLDSSTIHKTVHLTSNVGISGEVNLIWNLYEGKPYTSHDIMRSVNGGPFVSIANVANNITSYSDLTPPSGMLKYRIDLSTTSCTPTAKSTSYDAISSNSVVISPTRINSPTKDVFIVYPNPTDGKITINNNSKITKIEITNVVGQKLLSVNNNSNKLTVDISSFEKGVYFIRVNDSYTEKLVKE